jgi:hypothetical protein
MPSYRLSILRADQSTELLTFEQTTVVVGREGGDIVTADPKTSSRHAELTFMNGSLTFKDLQSTNGSFLASGERITQTITLTAGTSLKLGHCTLTIQEIQMGMAPGGTELMPQMHGAPAAFPVPNPHPQPAAAPAPIPQVQRASPAPAPQAQPAPPGAGLTDQFKNYLTAAGTLYQAHFVNGALTLGALMVPATVAGAALGLIPVIGWLFALIIALVELALTPLAIGAMARWALASAAGRHLTWSQAWGAAFRNPVQEWFNVFLAMIIIGIGTIFFIVPGIIVGMFALPAYLVEGKRLGGINLRSAELVMKDPGHHLGLAVLVMLAALPLAIGVGIASFILAFIPILGGLLVAVLTTAFVVVVLPFVYLVWTLIYFDTRQRLENVDPRVEGAAILQSWG